MRLIVLSIITCLASSALAADVVVANAWIRLLPGGAPAAGYFTLRNNTGRPMSLVGATSSAFRQTMMHKTVAGKGQSSMMHMDEVKVPAHGTVSFAPGGYHLMLVGPAADVSVGQRVAITLEFADGRKVTEQFETKGPSAR